MAIKVAINGFGRIGRLVYRIMHEDSNFDVVAVNDLTDSEQLAYLLKYDTNHGRYHNDSISFDNDDIIVDGVHTKVYSETEPKNLPWKELGVDVVFECTGRFTKLEDVRMHIEAGAKKVIISAPSKGDVKTVVYNVNDDILDGSEEVISAASCTTNCLAPVLKVINDNFGIEKGYMTTIHAYTNDQVTLDVAHKKGIKERRGRACATNIVPTSTGAASAIGKVIPELEGKMSGTAMRVPVSDGSLVDLVLELKKNTTVDELNNCLKSNCNETLQFTMDPIVSSDIITSTCGGMVDGQLTSVLDVDGKQLVKVVAWYDNEMGYSCQMVRTAKSLMNI
ncbi:MAG: type I glyceraldehyde-3-phosphate dehydrogenase [Bacilli bacterium]|nr:type I glyceraldehyde-3-phosphate dehydrogenase [Bacilli bacterium]